MRLSDSMRIATARPAPSSSAPTHHGARLPRPTAAHTRFAGILSVSLALFAVGAAVGFTPTPLHAQADPDREEARALFAAGQAAVEAGRWTDAVTAFQRAYTLTGVPSALFNTAFALRALGRFRDAEAAFVELLALEATRDEMRTEATGYLQEVRARLTTLRLLGIPQTATAIIRLDAEAVIDSGDRPVVLRADPGRHVLDVSVEGFERFEWAGELTDGQERAIAVELLALSGGGGGESGGGGGDVTSEAWFWVVIGIVVLGAAGGIVGGLLADDAAQLQPQSMMPIRL